MNVKSSSIVFNANTQCSRTERQTWHFDPVFIMKHQRPEAYAFKKEVAQPWVYMEVGLLPTKMII